MKSLKIIAFVLFALFITSCNKNDEKGTGIGDAVIISKLSGTNTVYGITLYAYTFSTFKSVTAVSTSEVGKIYTLKSNQGYKTNFYYETPDTEFTPNKPATSTFNFSAVFENGVTDEFQDYISDKVLAVPTVGSCAYNPTKKLLEVSWTKLTEADSYAVNILDGSNLVFASVELANTVISNEISFPGGGWKTDFTPDAGKTYTVRLYAFLYGPTKTTYDMQAASYAERAVVWGN